MKIDLPDSLSDGAVSLRPLRADDADAFGQAFRDDPELGVAIGVEKDPDEATVRERIPRIAEHAAQGDSAELAIADPGSDAFLGVVVLVNFDWRHRRCEIGFWLAAQARRKGIARRSVALMLDWAFDVLEMRRVELTTLPENEATVRLAESLGFNREGLMRARNFERGRAVDVIWFGVLRDEWAARA